MSAKVITDRLLSIDEYADLSDDDWHTELVRGRLVREPQPGYEQGRLQASFIGSLREHVRRHAPDFVVVGTLGVITTTTPDSVRGPDVALIARERATELHRAGFLQGAPEIAIEIVSPSNRAGEMQEKVMEYLSAGAGQVWIVYPDPRTVVVHLRSGEARLQREGDEIDCGDVVPGLKVPLAALFAD